MHIPNQLLVQLIHFRDQKWLSQTSNYSFACTFHIEVDASKYQMFQNIQKECSCRYTNCPIRQICKHQICERRTPEGTPYRGNRSITALQILPYKSKSQTAAIHITLQYTLHCNTLHILHCTTTRVRHTENHAVVARDSAQQLDHWSCV